MKKTAKRFIWWFVTIIILIIGYFIFQSIFHTKQNVNEEGNDGESIIYYKNGNIKEKWKYKDGQPIWEWNYYYENWQLKATRTFKWHEDKKMNVNVWKNTTYREDGTIESILTTEDDWTLISLESFDENWMKVSELNAFGMLYFNEDWTVSGILGKKWDEDDWYTEYHDYEKWIKSVEWKLINWAEEWEWTIYRKNWKIFSTVNYASWIKEWKTTEFYENWNISSQRNYVNWLEDWIQELYYENWNPLAVMNYKEWELIDGERYNEDWTVMTEDEFDDYLNYLLEWDITTALWYNENMVYYINKCYNGVDDVIDFYYNSTEKEEVIKAVNELIQICEAQKQNVEYLWNWKWDSSFKDAAIKFLDVQIKYIYAFLDTSKYRYMDSYTDEESKERSKLIDIINNLADEVDLELENLWDVQEKFSKKYWLELE